MKRLLSPRHWTTSLIFILLFFTLAPTAQALDSAQIQSVFPEAEVQQLFEQISSQAIEFDKLAPVSTRSRRSTVSGFGQYSTRTGVILVTPDKFLDILPLGHSAIIRSSTSVVEATARGVVVGPNNWYRTKNKCYAVSVRDTTLEQDKVAARWCYAQRRKPYNFNYFNIWTRSRLYCSQLIWAAYLDNFGINLDTPAFDYAIHPLELIATPKTYMIYAK